MLIRILKEDPAANQEAEKRISGGELCRVKKYLDLGVLPRCYYEALLASIHDV